MKRLIANKVLLASVSLLIVFLLIALTEPVALRENSEKTPEESYEEWIVKGEIDRVIERLKNTYLQPSFEDESYALGQVIARNATKGMAVFDRLQADDRLLSRSLQAELLVQTARGIELNPKQVPNKFPGADIVTTDQVAQRAIRLINDADPYVRGLADFAISIRVGLENAGSLREFPGANKPAWYLQWERCLTPDAMIEFDYVRQSAGLGLHRSAEKMKAECVRVIQKAADIVTYLESQGGAAGEAQAQMQKLTTQLKRIRSLRELPDLRQAYLQLRRQARDLIFLNPDLDFDQILFAQHHAFHDFGNITNGGKSFAIKPGGDLYLKDGFHPGGKLTGLIAGKLGPGHTRGFELHYDADRIVFSYAPQPDYYDGIFYESDQGFDDKAHGLTEPNNIYEVSLDGQIRQITDDRFHMDIEPTYLPNGDIVFSSDRANFGSQCCGSFYQNKRIINQYRMTTEGENIRPMSNNVHYDRYNHVLDNGQLIYTRWEYQERHLWRTHNLWTSRPDGSMADPLYKQHINDLAPMALRDARQIYGTDKLVAIGCGHHEWEQGAVMIIDPSTGTNDPNGMTNLTPFISKREGGIGQTLVPAGGGIRDHGGLYQQPFALSENSFLAAYSYNYPRFYTHGFNFGLYYIDIFGNKELIHRDPVLSAWYPVPVRKRPVPPVLTEFQNPDKDYALVYITDVNQGVPEVADGEIKYIRVAHHTEWPAEQIGEEPHKYNHLHYIPSGSWSRTLGMSTWGPARVIGTVPVEEDGSAYFKVPPDVPVYFQALDENLREVRRMRSFVTLQSGEVRGCQGCHETRDEAPEGLTYVPAALAKEPAVPKPPSWGPFTLPDYEEHIHPIFEKNCSGCHGVKDPAAGLEFSSRKVDGYYQAYRTLFGLSADDPTPVQDKTAFDLNQGKGHNVVVDRDALIKMENNEYPGQLVTISNKFSDNSVTKVRQFGSGASQLIDALMSDRHREKVQLTDQEWEDLVTWIDVNAPYWGTFIDKEPVREGERPRRIRIEIGKPFASERK